MEDSSEKKFDSAETSSRSSVVFFILSIVLFLVALITLWQGILKLEDINVANQSLRAIGKTILTLQNAGAALLVVSFFAILFSILFAVYAAFLKKK